MTAMRSTTNHRFGIDYYSWSRLLFSIGGHGPNVTYVDVSAETVRVRAGWVFQVDIPRSAIVRAYRRSNLWWNVGGAQTNMRGAWGVTGSYRNIVALELDPKAGGRLFSFLPVSIRRLLLSMEEPDGFLAAIQDKKHSLEA